MKIFGLIIIAIQFSLTVSSQSLRYTFRAPNAVHHEAEITLTADKLPNGPAYFQMSRSSPGRYARHEFGKNVYNVMAKDAGGKALKVEKADADAYKVSGHTGTVTLSYTLYANHADGTYASVDATGFHLNMPATFIWVKGMEKAPVSITFSLPDTSWKIATQLKPGKDATSFSAPGLQYFMDSPTKIGDLQFRDWKVTNTDGKVYDFRLAFEGKATPTELDDFATRLKRMVLEAKAVFGELPAYDYGRYTFIASINPYVKGDGMEHRNSTMISIPRNFDNSLGLLGVFSHEFFHCWNVERIRPADLEPFNFEKTNMSEGLWVAEGFTQYMGDVILKRAGLMDEEEFWGEMARLINTKLNTAGAQRYSPIENSQRAVFVDAGVAVDKTNYPNMYSSYYTYGGATALALDLELRTRFPNTSLDNFMQELWKRFGKTEKGYRVADLQPALAAVSSPAFAQEFFTKHVYGHEPYNYAEKLAQAGIAVKPASSAAWPGVLNFVSTDDLQLRTNTLVNTPIYDAGADIDDVLISMDGKKLSNARQVDTIMQNHQPGDVIPIAFQHRGKIISANMKLAVNSFIMLVPPAGNGPAAQQQFLDAWLGTKVK